MLSAWGASSQSSWSRCERREGRGEDPRRAEFLLLLLHAMNNAHKFALRAIPSVFSHPPPPPPPHLPLCVAGAHRDQREEEETLAGSFHSSTSSFLSVVSVHLQTSPLSFWCSSPDFNNNSKVSSCFFANSCCCRDYMTNESRKRSPLPEVMRRRGGAALPLLPTSVVLVLLSLVLLADLAAASDRVLDSIQRKLNSLNRRLGSQQIVNGRIKR